MDTFIGQLENLLLNPPGNLLYHLVLIFSASTILQAGFGLSGLLNAERRNRILTGAFLLLLLQTVIFLNSALAWQGVEEANVYLPPIDRSVITLSYIWILWMWGYPRPSHLADRVTITLSVAVTALLVFSVTAWKTQLLSMSFNSTLLDWSWSVLYTIILISGVLLVMLHKPSGWGFALVFLNINLLGSLAHMLWASPNSDFSFYLRFAQLVSFPLLPGMVYRLQVVSAPLQPTPDSVQPGRKPRPEEWAALPLAERTDAFFTTAARLIAGETGAAAVLWAWPLREESVQLVGYNLLANRSLSLQHLEARNLTALRKALLRNQPTNVDENPLTLGELSEIKQLTDLPNPPARLQVFPVVQEGKPLGAFLIAFDTADEYQVTMVASLLEGLQGAVACWMENQEKNERELGRVEALERELSAAHHQMNRQSEEITHLRKKNLDLEADVIALGSLEDKLTKLELENADLMAQHELDVSIEAPARQVAETPDVTPGNLQIPLVRLVDRIIDAASPLLLEHSLFLKLQLPESEEPILLNETIANTVHTVLLWMIQVTCELAQEETSLMIQATEDQGNLLAVSVGAQVNPEQHAVGSGYLAIIDAGAVALQDMTRILVRQSLEGNRLVLNFVLPV